MNNLNEKALEAAYKAAYQEVHSGIFADQNRNDCFPVERSNSTKAAWIDTILRVGISAYQAALPQADEVERVAPVSHVKVSALMPIIKKTLERHRDSHNHQLARNIAIDIMNLFNIQPAIAALKPARDLEVENKRLREALMDIQSKIENVGYGSLKHDELHLICGKALTQTSPEGK